MDRMPIDTLPRADIGRRTMRLLAPLAALVLITPVLLTACAESDDAEAASVDVVEEDIRGLQPGEQVPEVPGEVVWLNSAPGPFLEDGSVVLLDFWSYSCADCLRSLDAVADWHQRYEEHGLIVIGVHAPAFRFEEGAEELQHAVTEHGIRYPIAQDNDHALWTAFENEAWPARYVLGADGTVAHRFVGEGGYADTESAIRSALEAAGHDLSMVAPRYAAPPQDVGESTPATRDLYFGYRHNYHPSGVYAAEPDYYTAPEEPLPFADPGPPREDGLWYAQGMWRLDEDALVHVREPGATPGYVAFEFRAQTVTLVMGSTTASPLDVSVQLDDLPVPAEFAGRDVRWNRDGQSIVTVDKPRIYYVVELPAAASHSMRISADEEGLSLFLASFGAGIEGP